jgi:hypothetical protein
MRYLVLACDYDGTLAADGRIDALTADALRRVRETGRNVLLVTGRELSDVLGLLPEPELFDRIVAENGAILYRPASREERVLGEPPPDLLVSELNRRRVTPLSVGRVVVSTQEPNEIAVLDVIRQLGLERQVIFNKGAVMILPSGMNKASGLDAALEELGLSPPHTAWRSATPRTITRFSPARSAPWPSPTPCPRSRTSPTSSPLGPQVPACASSSNSWSPRTWPSSIRGSLGTSSRSGRGRTAAPSGDLPMAGISWSRVPLEAASRRLPAGCWSDWPRRDISTASSIQKAIALRSRARSFSAME